tara:strand:+ start:409 stop:936 length:528 start_codon:yes stop_codon:yes gene_type:complete
MLVTGDQFIIHAIGDYVLQSDWQANNKTKAHFPAFCHALTYSLPFLILTQSPAAWLTIFGTHFLIDRYRLARYVCWAKNWLAPKTWWKKVNGQWVGSSNQEAHSWLTWHEIGKPDILHSDLAVITDITKARTLPFSACSATGYPPDRPAWLAVWLLIITDNLCHILINAAAIRYL